MPVEIRELVIRAVTTRSAEDSEEQEQPEERLRRSEPADDTQAIIQECVRQVLRILQQNKER
jgi:Family of unknown function (DUF5908)